MNREALSKINPTAMIRPKRKITGISAILLPFRENGDIDWPGLADHVRRTAEAGLTPAVNMDTGFANLISEENRRKVLRATRCALAGGNFVAGAFVSDEPGAPFAADAYFRQVDSIQSQGGAPIIFQSYGLTQQGGTEIVRSYETIGEKTDNFIAFELGEMFAPFGAIYDLDTYRGLLGIASCIGAKHSSLNRQLEWERIALRDAARPDFKVFTGNDLAIDMVIYGSDYLLGLSTFAPDLFAERDAMWLAGDPGFYELNDIIQYLGFLAFRPPVPAYKHSAAQFLKLRGWINSDRTHSASPTRPASDVAILRDIAARMGILKER
ncbi:MAG: dihydrodipicolinate synthase family protein [Chloroflexota bacterium]|nr:dihydrodipicolinate synthase family protein [Chloroflexota bacterium]MDE2908938.1 dihydrodipicolinate synthase family protein [Chloroflexota bacterium]